jgi:O-succinylbenzoic acid--CoA ligase
MMPPEEFMVGREGVGRALPHARVEVVDEASGEIVPVGEAGRIQVRASSLFRGYHLETGTPSEVLLTADRGVLAADGSLMVLGRIDAIINTGGEKVDPAEVEAAIRATGLVRDVAVVGVPDAEWGEIVVAMIVGAPPGSEPEIAARAGARLSPPQRPKRWVHVAALPRTGAGKLDRRRLQALAEP